MRWGTKNGLILQKKFVLCHHSEDLVYYPVSRTGKRIALLAYRAADGSCLKPAVVIPRKTYDEDLLLFGITSEKVELYPQENGYISMPIFEDWFRAVFIPELEKPRESYTYTSPAFLIPGNCSAHTTQNCDGLYSVHGVLPIFLPPHSSSQTQDLDLSLFGVTKRSIVRVNRLDIASIQTFHITQVPLSFISAANPSKVEQSLKNAGISLVTGDEQLLCLITPETVRCLFDRDKVLNPLAIFEMELEDDDYIDDDPDDIDEEELLKPAAEGELI
jgi:hypothetical protein